MSKIDLWIYLIISLIIYMRYTNKGMAETKPMALLCGIAGAFLTVLFAVILMLVYFPN